jgi:GTP-binding protein
MVDLPGYGYAKRSKGERASWGPLIEGYLGQRQSLRALVLLVDARRGIEDEERELLEFVASAKAARPPIPVLLVATKVDKIPATERKPIVAKAGQKGLPPMGFSAVTGEGTERIWSRIRQAVLPEIPVENEVEETR